MMRPDWLPVDPDATPAEQALLDEANELLATLRLFEAGERITGTRPRPETLARINARLDAIRREMQRPTAVGS